MKTNTPAPRPRGRPISDNPRTCGLLLKLTAEEMAAIEEKAKRQKKTKARWVRELAMAA
ncbi:MAG TPA: hypothetical protein VGM54_25350 [Chthoniobacter sp.]